MREIITIVILLLFGLVATYQGCMQVVSRRTPVFFLGFVLTEEYTGGTAVIIGITHILGGMIVLALGIVYLLNLLSIPLPYTSMLKL